ncbi:MAG: hypothetical protein VKK98_00440 [Cyanobacteriota bacterium]|nr:hypothetical protein [Cyanobacteriota bacterium]
MGNTLQFHPETAPGMGMLQLQGDLFISQKLLADFIKLALELPGKAGDLQSFHSGEFRRPAVATDQNRKQAPSRLDIQAPALPFKPPHRFCQPGSRSG